tara:strand:+ start:64 stop:216 length:153 start_codon:yes stop_codon:yes gene_type:complete
MTEKKPQLTVRSQLFTSWEGRCIQNAIDELKRGIDIESKRLDIKKYLVTQ